MSLILEEQWEENGEKNKYISMNHRLSMKMRVDARGDVLQSERHYFREYHQTCHNICLHFYLSASQFLSFSPSHSLRWNWTTFPDRTLRPIDNGSDEGDTSSSSTSENEGKISYRDYEGPCCQPLLIVPPSSPVLPDKMNAKKKVPAVHTRARTHSHFPPSRTARTFKTSFGNHLRA